ncbi:hypothetical protein SIID45300_00337 [Candidatus Magnetaquicoccaceae bacterium FCR-1]|uniref:Uncharacterized protein n=1 Tax=Candidatus Magnetaquiglobus chichijimensis TaxID=3141448 RepID=A0ABQ0C566_9PROT
MDYNSRQKARWVREPKRSEDSLSKFPSFCCSFFHRSTRFRNASCTLNGGKRTGNPLSCVLLIEAIPVVCFADIKKESTERTPFAFCACFPPDESLDELFAMRASQEPNEPLFAAKRGDFPLITPLLGAFPAIFPAFGRNCPAEPRTALETTARAPRKCSSVRVNSPSRVRLALFERKWGESCLCWPVSNPRESMIPFVTSSKVSPTASDAATFFRGLKSVRSHRI